MNVKSDKMMFVNKMIEQEDRKNRNDVKTTRQMYQI